ncbi:MAG: hypothetical protein DDT42_01834 [candidate division WS2 bacterium]|uniref:Uncharacterized protein n=1 Tax=Psychracetigena formicireducens TaxID=2986056 RepID=A0A9E2BJ65_PSYF1|nr:hypothetical protein [Candidatus Psychracetigena formicireducens]
MTLKVWVFRVQYFLVFSCRRFFLLVEVPGIFIIGYESVKLKRYQSFNKFFFVEPGKFVENYWKIWFDTRVFYFHFFQSVNQMKQLFFAHFLPGRNLGQLKLFTYFILNLTDEMFFFQVGNYNEIPALPARPVRPLR